MRFFTAWLHRSHNTSAQASKHARTHNALYGRQPPTTIVAHHCPPPHSFIAPTPSYRAQNHTALGSRTYYEPIALAYIFVCIAQPGSYRHWPYRLGRAVGGSLYNFLIRYKWVRYVREVVRRRLNFLHGKTIADKVDKAFGNEVVLISAARILGLLLTIDGRGYVCE